jgi:hypothetical protein
LLGRFIWSGRLVVASKSLRCCKYYAGLAIRS